MSRQAAIGLLRRRVKDDPPAGSARVASIVASIPLCKQRVDLRCNAAEPYCAGLRPDAEQSSSESGGDVAKLPDLVSLVLFLRAIDSNSLSKAAEQSNIALAAASRRISLLEHLYGVQLLYRSTKGVEPTPAGKALAQHARTLLANAEKLQTELSDYAGGVKGHVRIQANTSAITQFLPSDLAAFSAKYPDVKLELVERRSGEIAQALREGNADIGVVMEGTEIYGLASQDYRRDRLVAVVPRRHPLRGRQLEFSQLARYDLIALDSSAAMMRLLGKAALDAGLPLRVRVQVWSFEAVCKLVQAGMGIGILPEAAAHDFAPVMGLRLIHLKDSWADRRMLVCVRDVAALSTVGQKLLDQLTRSRPPSK
jgi:DNA-binding transcriptional LysR family regulator